MQPRLRVSAAALPLPAVCISAANVSSYLYGDDLLDERVFGEALYRSLLADAVDSAAIRVEDGAVGIEVVAEDSFGDDFFGAGIFAAADQLPRFWNERGS